MGACVWFGASIMQRCLCMVLVWHGIGTIFGGMYSGVAILVLFFSCGWLLRVLALLRVGNLVF